MRLGAWVCAVLMGMMLLLAHPGITAPGRLVYIGTTQPKKQFSFNKTKVTWDEAVRLCNNEKKGLARIMSEEEQRQIETLLRKDPPEISVWISGREWTKSTSGTRNGQPSIEVGMVQTNLKYTNWDDGQPSLRNKTSPHCLALLNINYKWWLDECSTKKPFICEIVE